MPRRLSRRSSRRGYVSFGLTGGGHPYKHRPYTDYVYALIITVGPIVGYHHRFEGRERHYNNNNNNIVNALRVIHLVKPVVSRDRSASSINTNNNNRHNILFTSTYYRPNIIRPRTVYVIQSAVNRAPRT